MRNFAREALALALVIAPVAACTRPGETGPVLAKAERAAPDAAVAPSQCEIDRPGRCSGAWCTGLEQAVSAVPCQLVAELAAAKCDLGQKPDACLKPGERNTVELAALVDAQLVPLVREPARCGELEVVASSCREGLRLTYEFATLPNEVLGVRSRLDFVALDRDSGVPQFSTVFCGVCIQFGRLDGGWAPLALSQDEAQRLVRSMPQ